MRRKGRVAAGFVKVLCVIGTVFGANTAYSQMHDGSGDSLGAVSFPVSCAPAAQAKFNQAMALLHHMTYPQARERFRAIAQSDPTCAMAYWGIAMTLFQPVWPTRPGPRELHEGWDAIRKADSLHPPTERERMLITATEAFFRDPDSTDYWKRIRAWKEGMERAYEAFPEDNDIAALYALALLATIPPDRVSSPNNARAAEILLRILKENPRHPGAMHYLIHADDAPGREREVLTILPRYAAIAPRNPHALHMPTHIYTRLGMWREVIAGNIKAADAALEIPAGDNRQYVWDEFPHAIEYLIYAYLQTGADDEAALQLKRLQGTAGLQPSFKTAFHLSSTRARYALERRAWSEAAAIEPREPQTVHWSSYPWAEAIGWFARGLGSVHTGDSVKARVSQQRLSELEAAAEQAKEQLFARNIRVLRLDLTAWIDDARGMTDTSIAVLTRAAELEASTPKHPVTPAPTLPAFELLGDLLLKHGKASEASKAYEHSLALYPGRFNSLLGAARAEKGMGSLKTAAAYYRRLVGAARPDSKREGLQEARRFLRK